ncbi:hypothetical protein D9758_015192 [Tetrapyrgos nigripes]|uniref:Rhodopsin domain-containing protein n=1 Tax=Tetrapyrgos nigripes TaxID=182062 RepID=A0A8H5C0S3_9AGAR|nr:hypothetical protein D9758_015192 [Tetrapyrgos nigripes]
MTHVSYFVVSVSQAFNKDPEQWNPPVLLSFSPATRDPLLLSLMIATANVPIPTVTVVRVSSTVTHVVALCTTVYRVFYRLQISPFSWDDVLAFAATIMDITAVVSAWVLAHVNGKSIISSDTTPASTTFSDRRNEMTAEAFTRNRIIVYWVLNIAATLEIWLSRMSLAANFYRLLPRGKAKMISILLILWFMVCWVPTSAWKIHVCARDTSWASIPRGLCIAGLAEDILEIVIDALGCASLLALAGHVLWQMNIPFKERKLIIFLFVGAVFSAIACTIHALFTLSHAGTFRSFTIQIEAAISLAASNIMVILASIYNLLSSNHISSENNDRPSFDADGHSNRTATSVLKMFRPKQRAKFEEWPIGEPIKPAPFVDCTDHLNFRTNHFEPHVPRRATPASVPTLSFTEPEVEDSVSSFREGRPTSSKSDLDSCRDAYHTHTQSCNTSQRISSGSSCLDRDINGHPLPNTQPDRSRTGGVGRSTPEESSYYTESEPCSGSSIVILDPTDQSENESDEDAYYHLHHSRSESQGTSHSQSRTSSPSGRVTSLQITPIAKNNSAHGQWSYSQSLSQSQPQPQLQPQSHYPTYPPQARLPPDSPS